MDEGYRPHRSTVIMVSHRQYGEHACGRFPYSSANTVNPMLERRSLKAPIALGVVMIVLVVILAAIWIVGNIWVLRVISVRQPCLGSC